MNSHKAQTSLGLTASGRLQVVLGLLLLIAALGLQQCDAFGSINIFKHRYPFYGGYGYGYPFAGGYGAGYGGINIGGWGRR
jgi:hypothetical protein